MPIRHLVASGLTCMLLMTTYASASMVEVQMLNKTVDGTRGFEPAIVYIQSGDSVHFVATDKGHNVEQIPGMLPEGAKPFTGKISHDLTVNFSKPGVYGYRCVVHYSMGMVGLVVVGAPLNEDAARQIRQPSDAKARFSQLFQALDAHNLLR